MNDQRTVLRLAAVFKQAAWDRLMDDDGCPEGEQIRAGVEAVLAALKPGDVLPGGLVVISSETVGALLEARDFVANDLRGFLECVCVLEKDTYKPIESSMTEDEAREAARIRSVLSRIDAVIPAPPKEGE